ncbi:hypothetical protein WJX82_005228 [Trebouxia sp. C0006]
MLAVVLPLLVSAPWASAVRWSPQNFPNQSHDVNSCGRHGKPSWICDPDHVLSEYNQNLIEGSIHEIAEGPYSTAHCSAGYQVALALAAVRCIWLLIQPSAQQATPARDLIIAVLIILIIFCIFCWVSYKDRREASKCQSMLQKLKTEQATAVQAQRYPAMSCPICFEDLEQGDGLPTVPSSAADLEAGMAGAHGTHHFSKEAEASGCASSSKVDNTPSAPPLDSHPECESLLGNDMRMLSGLQDEHEPDRDAAGRKLKPMWLSCGHAFCQDCITSWLQDKNSCPICRQPVAATRPDPIQHSNPTRGSSLPPPNVGLNRQRHDWDNAMYALEVKFRLARLQLYPQYVNNDMVSGWASHTSRGQVVNWDAARDMQLNNPAVRQSRHDRGSHGASTNFGGGGGRFGGGGSGASW